MSISQHRPSVTEELARTTAERVRESAVFKAAEADLLERDEDTLDRQIELTEIPAPPFAETRRGERMGELFEAEGLEPPTTDAEGNVLSWYPDPGAGPAPLIVSAHLDTVFPEGTDTSVTREGDRLFGPGIGDDGRGLAGLLALARAFNTAGARFRRPLLFAATVGEEGAGNLRGVRHLFGPDGAGRDAAAFISLDGAGFHVIHRAVGSRRFRVTVTGPGGHSWADYGLGNPLHALGDAVARVTAIRLLRGCTLSVGRLEGGTSVNAIPEEAWLEMEIRSESEKMLDELEPKVRAALTGSVEAENQSRKPGSPPLEIAIESLGRRPGGSTPTESPLVRAAVEATHALGRTAALVSSSTDANVPMSLGIDAITLGAGGEIGAAHTLGEWYRNTKGPDGLARALLTLLVLDELLAE